MRIFHSSFSNGFGPSTRHHSCYYLYFNTVS